MVGARTLEDELAFGQSRDGGSQCGNVHAPGRRSHPFQQTITIALGLETTHHPRGGVGQHLVVNVHWVLSGQHHAHAKRSALLHQGEDGCFGGRVGGGRYVAEDFVDIDKYA